MSWTVLASKLVSAIVTIQRHANKVHTITYRTSLQSVSIHPTHRIGILVRDTARACEAPSFFYVVEGNFATVVCESVVRRGIFLVPAVITRQNRINYYKLHHNNEVYTFTSKNNKIAVMCVSTWCSENTFPVYTSILWQCHHTLCRANDSELDREHCATSESTR